MSKSLTLEERQAIDREEARMWVEKENSTYVGGGPAYMTRDVATESRRSRAVSSSSRGPRANQSLAELLMQPFNAAQERNDADAMFEAFQALEPKLFKLCHEHISDEAKRAYDKGVKEAKSAGDRKSVMYTQDIHIFFRRMINQALAMVQEESLKTSMLLQIHRTRRLALEKRIEALEKGQKAMCYRGVYDTTEHYEKGNFVTHGGSMWAALADEPGKPGASDGWQLAVKRGADAR